MAKKSVASEVLVIRRSFAQLAASFARLGPALEKASKEAAARPAAGNGMPSRRRPKLSPKHRAALKLQGRYMGMMRGMKPRDAAAIKRIRAEKGIQAAIRAAERMAG